MRTAFVVMLLLSTPDLHAASVQANLIESIVQGGHAQLGPGSEERQLHDALVHFYEPYGYAPAWLNDGVPGEAARNAVDLLGNVAGQGLNPDDYKSSWLRRTLGPADGGRLSPLELAQFDVTLSAAMLRLLRDLHYGRVDPREIGWQLDVAASRHYDPVTALRAAIAKRVLGAAVQAAQPRLPVYTRLEAALATYRKLAREPDLQPIPEKRTVKPGERYSGVAPLARLLTALGDLPAGSAVTPGRYDGKLVEAIRRFQTRHGLDVDGVMGKATFTELNRPLRERVRTIELALERLRWLPELAPGPVIAVNVPSFKLWAFSDPRQSAAELEMNVVVGRSVRTRTPIFMQDMKYVQFSPYWNVPYSILRKEIIPKLRRDPTYLERENMEFVAPDGTVTTEVSDATVSAARTGELRLRQRPGPDNALGGIKFVLPNAMNIYLHGTPAQSLFGKARRDFSHGCIRVADPVGLAHFVLGNDETWSRSRIEALIESGDRQAVRLPQPIPVIIFYSTAVVDHTGRVLFPPDIYHFDPKLEAALAAAAPGR